MVSLLTGVSFSIFMCLVYASERNETIKCMPGPVKATCRYAETLPKDKTPHFISFPFPFYFIHGFQILL